MVLGYAVRGILLLVPYIPYILWSLVLAIIAVTGMVSLCLALDVGTPYWWSTSPYIPWSL